MLLSGEGIALRRVCHSQPVRRRSAIAAMYPAAMFPWVEPLKKTADRLKPVTQERHRLKPVLRQHFTNHVPTEISQLFVAPVVQEPQAILIQAEQLQNGRVEIAHRITRADATQAHLVGLADNRPRLHAAASKPH